LGCFAFLAERAQFLEALHRLFELVQFQQRVGMAKQNGRVLGPMALGALTPFALGFVPAAKGGGGLGDLHARADGGRVLERLLGAAIFALGIERLLGGAPHAARGASTQELGQDDGYKIDRRAQRPGDDQDPKPVHFSAGAHDMNAAKYRRQIGEDEIEHA
jgi:hypothetical protein